MNPEYVLAFKKEGGKDPRSVHSVTTDFIVTLWTSIKQIW